MTPPDRSRRRAATERRRGASRGRVLGAFSILVVVAGGIAACTTITEHRSGTTTTTVATGGSGSSTSTTAAKPTTFNVGLTTFDWKDPSGVTVNPVDPDGPGIAGRVLTTQVRYPTLGGSAKAETTGASPATSYGPFPVVVFAHGFDVSPLYYAPLLDSWVRAGFIVVSPIFPDENTAKVHADGGPYSPDGSNDEDDVTNEPGDIPFVLKQFDAVAALGSGSALAGLANTSDVAVAGQSDGADVVAALVFGSAYKSDLAAMPVAPRAVAVLSGAQLFGGGNATVSSSTSPAVLQVQSTADTCNPAEQAADLFQGFLEAPVHLFETLYGASHLEPYTNRYPPNRYQSVVEAVTTEFFKVELGWHDKGLSIASVVAAGAEPGTSLITTNVSGFPKSPSTTACAGQLP